MFGQVVRKSAELDRILRLPRKTPHPEDTRERLTQILRTPEGTQELKPIQAEMLYELGRARGLFASATVGAGKTLTSLMASRMVGAKKTVLVTKASLRKKTIIEMNEYRKNWRLPPEGIEIVSYEELSRVKFVAYLNELKPDLLIFDEVQALKNRKASRTKRVMRFMKANPTTMVVALSGTVMKKSIQDFAHIIAWCLKDKCPLPLNYVDLDEWTKALDEKVNELDRYEVGALKAFSDGEDDLQKVRQGFREHLIGTPGVVATQGKGEDVGCTVTVNAIVYDLPTEIDGHFAKLRGDMQTPDGWQLTTGAEVWMHARQLALGLYYAWDPRPPDWWRNPRREWGCFVREVLSHSRTLDSELMVVNACDAGSLDSQFLERWREVKNKFTPNIVSRWCDDTAINICLEWMQQPGIVWVEHTLFGARLAELSGCKYYGPQGLAADGEFINDADPTKAAIVSFDANKAGRNLQAKWSRCLYTAIREGADDLEQSIGRIHRDGQLEDEVIVDVLVGCREHLTAMKRAISASEAIRDTTGAEYKILSADFDWPDEDETDTWIGARW